MGDIMKFTTDKPTEIGWRLIKDLDRDDVYNIGKRIKYIGLVEIYPHCDYGLMAYCEQLGLDVPLAEFDGFEFSDQIIATLAEPEEA